MLESWRLAPVIFRQRSYLQSAGRAANRSAPGRHLLRLFRLLTEIGYFPGTCHLKLYPGSHRICQPDPWWGGARSTGWRADRAALLRQPGACPGIVDQFLGCVSISHLTREPHENAGGTTSKDEV